MSGRFACRRFYGSLGQTILPFSYSYSTFATICALSRNGQNSQCTVIGSSGKIPYRISSTSQIKLFRDIRNSWGNSASKIVFLLRKRQGENN